MIACATTSRSSDWVGSAARLLAACAQRGARVIGLEQFGPAHELGSSSGRSRLIRKAYFEDPAYVPLLAAQLRSMARTGARLGRGTAHHHRAAHGRAGGLCRSSPARSRSARGACARRSRVLGQSELQQRYPTLRFLPNEIGVFEPDGGVLVPERAVEAQLRVAARAGRASPFRRGR